VTRFICLDEVLELHRLLLEESGGMPGIRDLNMLESAVAQPLMTFGGQELYPTIADKASAICFSLVMNHPFIDGNKRVGHAAMETFLVLNGYELACSVDDQEQEILCLAAGEIKRESLTEWIRGHLVQFGGILDSQEGNPTRAEQSTIERIDCPELIHSLWVICYTSIDSRHRRTGNTRHLMGSTVLGRVARLAVCKSIEPNSVGYFLFGCDEQWNVLSDTWHGTLQDAKHQAEFEYEGVSETWNNKQ
jgi:death-on-curing protein